MAPGNGSFVTEFILLGLTEQPDLQLPLFFLFLVMYMVSVLGNLGLMTLIGLSSHLHTPMYFFLFNLSFVDFCYSSVFTPKMLTDFLSKKNVISYMGCMTQFYFFWFFVVSECYVLTSMAYDRYVAICKPLLYNIAMSPAVCSRLVLGSYLMAFFDTMTLTGCLLRLTFCDANTINHYFCDILPLLQLSCTGTYVSELAVFIVGGINIIFPSLTISVSYGLILSSILRISSREGRSKAFSTCSSHVKLWEKLVQCRGNVKCKGSETEHAWHVGETPEDQCGWTRWSQEDNVLQHRFLDLIDCRLAPTRKKLEKQEKERGKGNYLFK
ncbi:olfactory receptor 8B3-like [Vicugna pacos]|uniref:Olfactory receptor n=1 Tax=Vicugna pacos TaxID=30538 RepID=A0ABM5CMJ1_VICPA